jgi:hypothetical protein
MSFVTSVIATREMCSKHLALIFWRNVGALKEGKLNPVFVFNEGKNFWGMLLSILGVSIRIIITMNRVRLLFAFDIICT